MSRSTKKGPYVDRMRRRVVELDRGEIVRDQVRGVYGIDEGVAI